MVALFVVGIALQPPRFCGNRALYGGALTLLQSQLCFCGNVLLVNNSAYSGGAMHTMICYIHQIFHFK